MPELETTYLPAIARALGYLCLQSAKMEEKTMLQKAKFLEGLGLGRSDAAAILGTSTASLAELQRQANKKQQTAEKKATA